MPILGGAVKTGIRFSFLLVMVGVVALAVSACGGKKRSEALSEAPATLEFPAAGTPGLIDIHTAPAGVYRIAKVRGSVTEVTYHARADFIQFIAVPGQIQKTDAFKAKSDWSQWEESKKLKAYLAISLNLPYEIDADGSSVKFEKRHLYKQSASGSGLYGFRAEEAESLDGGRFYEAFTSPVVFGFKDGIYAPIGGAINLKAAARLEGDTLIVYAAGDYAVVEITYQK